MRRLDCTGRSPNEPDPAMCVLVFEIDGHTGCCKPVLDEERYHFAFFECQDE